MNKILIVEDDMDYAELIIDEFNTEDIKKEIILMKDGQELIDYFHESNIDDNVGMELQIDLIISDLNMPKVHGMDVLKFLKKNSEYSKIPVIILSTSSNKKTIDDAYENGANDYIVKPASYEEFVEKIKS